MGGHSTVRVQDSAVIGTLLSAVLLWKWINNEVSRTQYEDRRSRCCDLWLCESLNQHQVSLTLCGTLHTFSVTTHNMNLHRARPVSTSVHQLSRNPIQISNPSSQITNSQYLSLTVSMSTAIPHSPHHEPNLRAPQSANHHPRTHIRLRIARAIPTS